MNHLADFFQALASKGRKIHSLNSKNQAKYIKFSGNLVVYFDNEQGYDILRLTDLTKTAHQHDRFHPGLSKPRPRNHTASC